MRIAFLKPAGERTGGANAFYAGLLPALIMQGHTADLLDGYGDIEAGMVPVIDGMLLPDLEPHLDQLLAMDAIAVIHHISARAGRDPVARQAVRAAEQRMLPRFRRVVATSADVAGRLGAEFGIQAAATFHPGLPDLPRSPGSDGHGCEIICIGVLTPRKGQDRLLQALARLTDLDWTLTIAGDARRDPLHAASILAQSETLGLQSRVTVLQNPAPPALELVWQQADLFALASSWEGYASAAAEALRRGIPVIGWNIDGLSCLVTSAGGILCDPDDPATFSKCLRRAIADAGLRTALAEGAWQAGLALPGWPQQALAFDAILRS